MNQIENKKSRYFDEVMDLAYRIENAETKEDLILIGHALFGVGLVLKTKKNYD